MSAPVCFSVRGGIVLRNIVKFTGGGENSCTPRILHFASCSAAF
jgi:hypothetical protein